MRVSPRLVASLAAIAIAGGIVVVVGRDDDGRPSAWDERIVELVEFVEDERGHRFEHPVPVDFLDEEAYAELTRTEAGGLTDEEIEEMEDTEGLLRALGLVAGEVDLLESLNDLTDTGTLAYYDIEAERVVVRGTDVTPDLAVTLVHELTHVLQDQVFGLDLLGDSDDAEDATSGQLFAFRALAEGDADRVELAYYESLDADEQAAIDETIDAGLDDLEAEGIPPALEALFGSPYAVGGGFIGVLEATADDAVDDAFREPPTTEEHLLDPFSYLDGDDPASVSPPGAADAEVFDEGDFGAVSLLVVLAERVDFDVALRAALGWGGDAYVAFRRGERVCVSYRVEGDEPSDTDELEAALLAWASAVPTGAVTVERTAGGVEMESCDLGDEAVEGSGGSVDAMQTVAIRTQIIDDWLSTGAPRDAAICFADAVLAEFTLEELVAETSPADLDARLLEAASGCQ